MTLKRGNTFIHKCPVTSINGRIIIAILHYICRLTSDLATHFQSENITNMYCILHRLKGPRRVTYSIAADPPYILIVVS